MQEVVALGVRMWTKVCCSLFHFHLYSASPTNLALWLLLRLLLFNFTVNTKVDMRFNVQNAYWLSDRVRQRIMQMVRYVHLYRMHRRICFIANLFYKTGARLSSLCSSRIQWDCLVGNIHPKVYLGHCEYYY